MCVCEMKVYIATWAFFSEMAKGVYPGGPVFDVVGSEGQWDALHRNHSNQLANARQ